MDYDSINLNFKTKQEKKWGIGAMKLHVQRTKASFTRS